MKEIPVKFSKISGNFFCSNNKLTSLKDSPKLVNGDFRCHNNKLTSLQGGPEKIDGNFTCNNKECTEKIICCEYCLLDFHSGHLKDITDLKSK